MITLTHLQKLFAAYRDDVVHQTIDRPIKRGNSGQGSETNYRATLDTLISGEAVKIIITNNRRELVGAPQYHYMKLTSPCDWVIYLKSRSFRIKIYSAYPLSRNRFAYSWETPDTEEIAEFLVCGHLMPFVEVGREYSLLGEKEEAEMEAAILTLSA